MSNPIRKPAELEPRGPEGVPIDAPGNEASAISPHAVSRMHRAEDDATAFQNSPEFTDQRTQSNAGSRTGEQWQAGAPGTGRRDDVSHGFAAPEDKRGRATPSHGTTKDAGAPPKGRGDGEMQEQPATQAEARQPGADNPQFDE